MFNEPLHSPCPVPREVRAYRYEMKYFPAISVSKAATAISDFRPPNVNYWAQRVPKWEDNACDPAAVSCHPLPSVNRLVNQKLSCCSVKLCLILCDPMDCIPPGFSVHGILQPRILEWVAISSSRGSSWTMGGSWISCITGRLLCLSRQGSMNKELRK